jgi:hypothetical protein
MKPNVSISKQVQCVYLHTLPWLISISLGQLNGAEVGSPHKVRTAEGKEQYSVLYVWRASALE